MRKLALPLYVLFMFTTQALAAARDPLVTDFLQYGRTIEKLLRTQQISDISALSSRINFELNRLEKSLDGPSPALTLADGETLDCGEAPKIACVNPDRTVTVAKRGFENLSLLERHELVALKVFEFLKFSDRVARTHEITAYFAQGYVPSVPLSEFKHGFLLVQGEPGLGQKSQAEILRCPAGECQRPKLIATISLGSKEPFPTGTYQVRFNGMTSAPVLVTDAWEPVRIALVKVRPRAPAPGQRFEMDLRINYSKRKMDVLAFLAANNGTKKICFEDVHRSNVREMVRHTSVGCPTLAAACEIPSFTATGYHGKESKQLHWFFKEPAQLLHAEDPKLCRAYQTQSDSELLENPRVTSVAEDGSVTVRILDLEVPANDLSLRMVDRPVRLERIVGKPITSEVPEAKRFWAVFPGNYVLRTTAQGQTSFEGIER